MRKDYTPEYAAFPAPRRRLMRARPPNSPYGLRQWLHRALPGLLVPTGNQLTFPKVSLVRFLFFPDFDPVIIIYSANNFLSAIKWIGERGWMCSVGTLAHFP